MRKTPRIWDSSNWKNGNDRCFSIKLQKIPWISDIHYLQKVGLRYFFLLMMISLRHVLSFKKVLKNGKKNAVGDIAPLLGYGHRSFDFYSEQGIFFNKDQRKSQFYQITLIGEAWVSRHYLELYNANKIWEIQQMRKIVKAENNCDDIAMNFLVYYLYSEFHSIPLEGKVEILINLRDRQFNKRDFIPRRNECTKHFTQILGFNPVLIINKKAKENEEKRFIDPLKKRFIYEKRRMLEELLIKGHSEQTYTPTFGNCEQSVDIGSQQFENYGHQNNKI